MYKLLPLLLFAVSLAVTTDDIYDNSYALIIGIDKYENVRSLDYAVKDAEDIQSMLVDKFNFQQDNIVLLKNEEATQASILQEFSNITKKANDNDRVLIFFAGHGETIDLPDGGEMGFLLPVDGDKTDLYLSAIKMEELRTLSLLSDAKHILYLVDACYGGIVSVGARGLDAESTPNYLDKITKYKSRQIISAGGRGEEVIEKAEWGHSAFTKNLLSGLRDSKADTDSDGIITVQELGTYLQKKVTIDSDNRQTPKTRNLSSDEGEFVFVYSENTVVIQDESADKKDELETKKSIGVDKDETLLDRARLSQWSKRYPKNIKNPAIYGIYAVIMEDAQGILLATSLAPGWAAGIGFESKKSSLLNESTQEFHSNNGNMISLYIIHSLIKIESIWIEGRFAMHYSNFSLPNKITKILPAAGIHIGLVPLPSILPPLILGLSMGATPYPKSYNEIDGTIQLDDWEIQFLPTLLIGLAIPKWIIFPE